MDLSTITSTLGALAKPKVYGRVGMSTVLPPAALLQVSRTNTAADCFLRQQFSTDLQAFMISYSKSVSGMYSIYS